MFPKSNIEFKAFSSGSRGDNLVCSMFPPGTVFTNTHVVKELFVLDFLIIVNSLTVLVFRTVIKIIRITTARLSAPHPLTSLLLILQSVQRSQGGATEANKAPLENQLDNLETPR